MAFGKAVTAEALDLLEASSREISFISAACHAADHLFLVLMDRADVAEGRHRPSETIGLIGGKACGDDGQFHCLLLKERHALGFSEHLFEFVRFRPSS